MITLSAMTVSEDGTTISVVFDTGGGGNLTLTSGSEVTGFTVYVDSQSVSITTAAITAHPEVTITLDTPIKAGQNVKVSLNASTNLTDQSADPAPSFTQQTATNNSTVIAAWVYAGEPDVIDCIAAANLEVLTNQENETANRINSNRVQRAGDWADAKMNQSLAVRHSLPLSGLSANDNALLRDISVNLVISKLSEWRVIQFLAQKTGPNVLEYFDRMRQSAEQSLTELEQGIMLLSIDNGQYTNSPAGNANALDISGQRIYPYNRQRYLPWC